MSAVADKSDPKLWEKVKKEVTAGDRGGKPGQWSARKAQVAVGENKAKGGGYEGVKSADNHLAEWTEAEWGTKSGRPSAETGERYLPKRARDGLTDAEYRRTTRKKRADTARGKQFSSQPDDVKRKTAADRKAGRGEPTKAALIEKARKRNVPGRSRMSKAELAKAVS